METLSNIFPQTIPVFQCFPHKKTNTLPKATLEAFSCNPGFICISFWETQNATYIVNARNLKNAFRVSHREYIGTNLGFVKGEKLEEAFNLARPFYAS